MEINHWAKNLGINYATLTVCQQAIPSPFSRWTQTHVNQGFAWRPQAVSFATFASDGSYPLVEIDVMDSYAMAEVAVRIIRVPFQALTGGIEVTSPLGESWQVELPASDYNLFYAIEADPHGSVAEPWLYQLTFVKTMQTVPAKIIRAEKDLAPLEHLDMSAEPA